MDNHFKATKNPHRENHDVWNPHRKNPGWPFKDMLGGISESNSSKILPECVADFSGGCGTTFRSKSKQYWHQFRLIPRSACTARDASRNDSLQWCGCTTMVHDDFLVDIAHNFRAFQRSHPDMLSFFAHLQYCVTSPNTARHVVFASIEHCVPQRGHQRVYRHGPYVGSQPIFFYSKPWWKSVFFVKMDQNDWPNRPERHEFLGKTSKFVGK